MNNEVVLTGHPDNDYNGLYNLIDNWNDKPHYTNYHHKHIYFYNKKYGGYYGWNLDHRDQSFRENPGELAWNDGGYI